MERLAELRRKSDPHRVRSREECTALRPPERIREAVKRCKVKNFDDLDFLFAVFGSTQGGTTEGTELSSYKGDLRIAVGAGSNNEKLKGLLEKWRDERDAAVSKKSATDSVAGDHKKIARAQEEAVQEYENTMERFEKEFPPSEKARWATTLVNLKEKMKKFPGSDEYIEKIEERQRKLALL